MEVQLKKYIVFVRCEVIIFEVLKACVSLAMAYLLVVHACFFAICTAKGLLQLFQHLLDKIWKGKSKMSWQNRWEPRSFSQLQGQRMLSEGCVSDEYTHIHLYSSSFHGCLLPQISFCDPHPTVFLSFSFFLQIQIGFKEKAAFDPTRFVNLPTNIVNSATNLPRSTSNFTITKKK